MKRDQQIQIQNNVELHSYNGVLFPENSYFYPLPMPEEWMDILKDLSRKDKYDSPNLNKEYSVDILNNKKLQSLSPKRNQIYSYRM